MQKQTMLTFQVEEEVKKALKRKSLKKGQNLSEYLRDLVKQDVGLNSNFNPWLNLVGTLTEAEAKETIKEIQKSRKSKNWDKVAKSRR